MHLKKRENNFQLLTKKKLLSFQLQDGEEDESPYIGKARFKPNKFTRKSNIAGGEQHAEVITMGSRPSERYREQNKQVQEELHDSLIFDLRNKERAIQQGQWPSHKIIILNVKLLKIIFDCLPLTYLFVLTVLIFRKRLFLFFFQCFFHLLK